MNWQPEKGDAWEPEPDWGHFDMPRKSWWGVMLETDWASTHEIDSTCGPMYRMFSEMPQ